MPKNLLFNPSVFFLMSVLICLSLITGCKNDAGNGIETKTAAIKNDGIQQTDSSQWDERTKENMAFYKEEITKARYIVNRPNAYEKESFDAYYDMFEMVFWMTMKEKQPVTDDTIWMIGALKEAREKLIQLKDPEEDLIYIWDDNMPVADNAEYYDYTFSMDNDNFKPFLVPYILEDQSNIKGNIIVIAGGGFFLRSNLYEGYAVAERFNELGYNAYVLQRRVAPSEDIDSSLDLQRSIRYLKYYADDLGVSKTNFMAACGFSGGGMTILNMLSGCYGDELPTEIYEGYKADEVDKINGDLNAAIIMYGVMMRQENQQNDLIANPGLPAMFICAGQEDSVAADKASLSLYDLVEKTIPAELHVFSGAGHRFGADWGFSSETFSKIITENTKIWPMLADTFIQIQSEQMEQVVPYKN